MGLGYLIPIMWSCLSLAALIGALFTGFWLSSANARKHEVLKKSLNAKLRQSEQDRNTRIARLTSDLEKHRTQIPTLEDSLAARSALIAAQETKLDEGKKQLELIAQQLTDEQQRTDAGDQLVNTLQQTVSALERDRAELEKQMGTLSQKNRELQSAHSRIASELDKSHKEAQLIAEEAEQFRQRMQEHGQDQQARHAIERQLKEMRSSHDELGDQLKARDAAVSELQTELHARNVELEELHQSLAEQLEIRDARMGDLQDELLAKLAGSEELRRSLAEQLEIRDARMGDLQDELLAKLAGSEELRRSLAEQLEIRDARMGDLQDELLTKLAESEAQRQSLTGQLEIRDSKMRDLQDELLAKLAESEAQRQSLTGQLEIRDAKMGDLQDELLTKLAESEAQRQSLAGQLEIRDSKMGDLQVELNAKLAESEAARQSLAEQQQALSNLTAEHERIANKLAESTAHGAHTEELHTEIRRELQVAHERIQQMELGLENAERQTQQECESRKQWQGRCQTLESELASRSSVDVADAWRRQDRDVENLGSDRLATLRSENNKLSRALKRAQRNLRSQASGGIAHQGMQTHRADENTRENLLANGTSLSFGRIPRPGPSEQLSRLISTAPDERDNLQEIRGIGPIMAKTLNELGIYRFQQVAALRAEDIAWIASHINTFPGRIERDQWVSQAARLSHKKDGS